MAACVSVLESSRDTHTAGSNSNGDSNWTVVAKKLGLEKKMAKFVRKMATNEELGVTQLDILDAMRRQNRSDFAYREVQNLLHSSLYVQGTDAGKLRIFIARIVGESIDNYLREYAEALQLDNDRGLSKYRLLVLFSQEMGGDADKVAAALQGVDDCAVVKLATLQRLVESRRYLQICAVQHIFRKELRQPPANADFFAVGTAPRPGSRRRSCRLDSCGIL